MEDDLKENKNGRRPTKNKIKKNLFSIPLKFRGKPFLGLAQLSKIFCHSLTQPQPQFNLNMIITQFRSYYIFNISILRKILESLANPRKGLPLNLRGIEKSFFLFFLRSSSIFIFFEVVFHFLFFEVVFHLIRPR